MKQDGEHHAPCSFPETWMPSYMTCLQFARDLKGEGEHYSQPSQPWALRDAAVELEPAAGPFLALVFAWSGALFARAGWPDGESESEVQQRRPGRGVSWIFLAFLM